MSLKFFKETHYQKHSVIFPMPECEPMHFAKRQMQTTKWKNTEIHCKSTGGVPRQYRYFARIKTMLALPVNPFNASVDADGSTVRQSLVSNLAAVEMKLTKMQDDLVLNIFS